MPPCRQPARAAEHRTATSGGITTTPVAVPAVPGGRHIGSICLHDAPSHYTSARNTTSQHHSTTAPQHQRCSVCHPAQAQPPAEGQPPHIPANHAARLHRVRARCDSVAFPLPHPFAHWRSVTDLRRAVSPVTRCASPPHTSHRKNKKNFRAFCARPQKAGRQHPPSRKKQKKFSEPRIGRVYYGKGSGGARMPDGPEPPPLAQSQRKRRAPHQHRAPLHQPGRGYTASASV